MKLTITLSLHASWPFPYPRNDGITFSTTSPPKLSHPIPRTLGLAQRVTNTLTDSRAVFLLLPPRFWPPKQTTYKTVSRCWMTINTRKKFAADSRTSPTRRVMLLMPSLHNLRTEPGDNYPTSRLNQTHLNQNTPHDPATGKHSPGSLCLWRRAPSVSLSPLSSTTCAAT